jgi:hypothetical protein
MKTQWPSAAAKLKGDMLMSSDMEYGKRRSGLEGVTTIYMSPDCGSIMYVSWHASK